MPILKTATSNASQIPSPLLMSEEDFIDWNPDEPLRPEWVDGKVEIMHAVLLDHANLTQFISRLMGGFVEENDLGAVYCEPFQVRLPLQRRRRMPDLFYVSNERLKLLETTQFNGAPDLIVEVISRDSKLRDKRVKFNEYQNAGVKEYWLPDPLLRTLQAYTLNQSGKYESIPLVDGQVNSIVLKGLFFRQEWVWQLKLPKTAAMVEQMSQSRKKQSSARKRR